jgi:predicted 3-demethylubiquinone-9 3-methyltransferase (glyoxalase superfamily)
LGSPLLNRKTSTMSDTQKITPCLWFENQALEAAQFYTSLLPNSEIRYVQKSGSDYPGGKAGAVLMVAFTIAGHHYQALNGGPHDAFNNAISLSISCADQAEVDRLWAALTADGGKPVQCGWLKDKYGLSWQIVPKRLVELMSDPDAAKSKRVMQAMMQMVKLDIAQLEAAASG